MGTVWTIRHKHHDSNKYTVVCINTHSSTQVSETPAAGLWDICWWLYIWQQQWRNLSRICTTSSQNYLILCFTNKLKIIPKPNHVDKNVDMHASWYKVSYIQISRILICMSDISWIICFISDKALAKSISFLEIIMT